MIRRYGRGFKITSKTGKSLGVVKTKKAALRRLKQIEYFKKKKTKNVLKNVQRNNGSN